MTKPEAKHIPDDAWKSMVRHGITPSMNLVVNDGTGAFLFLMRSNEPMKGRWWVPGGRIKNGETKEAAVRRLAHGELGLAEGDYDVLHVSDRHNEEIFHVHHMDADHAKARYGDDIETVHYWGGVSYLRMKGGAAIELDSQSAGFEWFREIPADPHEYLLWYFRVVRDAGFPVPPLPEGL